jgi:alkylation response protein AidB-like acyl-CoA dehydrogenase
MNAKLIGVEFALDSADTAMEIHCAAGPFPDLPVDRYLRDAFHGFAPAGTSDVQLIRLAEGAALRTDRGRWSQ